MITPKTFLAAVFLVGFCVAQIGSAFAQGTNATFYTNSLTNTEVPLTEHFLVGGGGYGSFEVNDGVGLELLSQAPNWYEAVRAFKIPLTAGVSWTITVRAHVSSSLGATQTNPSYVASLVLTKLARNPDGFASVLSTAPNRYVLSLARSDGLVTNNADVQNVVTSYRKSQGVDFEDTRVPFGNVEDVYLRFSYSAEERQLTASRSLDGIEFQSFETANLGDESEWQLEDTDSLAVALSVSSVPYAERNTPPRDFYSTYDSYGMGDYDPSQLPEIQESVGSGRVYLSDFRLTYTPSNWDATTLNIQSLYDDVFDITVLDVNQRHLALPEHINGVPLAVIASLSAVNSELISVVLPATVRQIGGLSFTAPNLSTINIPPTIENIGQFAFEGCPNLFNVVIPDHLVFRSNDLGLGGSTAYRMFVQQIADTLAQNELLMAALATNEKFIGLLAFKILSRFQAYGLVTRNDLSTLATKQELQIAIDQGKTQGINSLIANPNEWSLFTKDQIQGMSVGDLMLQPQTNGSFVLNYDIEQSDDLATWTPYKSYAEPLTLLPTDKKFLRIRVKQ
jgi:hypothetical protein